MTDSAARSSGFAAVSRPDARVLILGTLPGVASLAAQQYYAKKQNAFWPIIGDLFGVSPDLPYEARLEALRRHHIALWDVLASAERAGSLDSAIKAPEINDFAGFFAAHPAIGTLAFNGQGAFRLYQRHVGKSVTPSHLTVTVLPSTSPAYAAMRFADKLEHWRSALDTDRPPPPGSRQE